MLNNKDKDKDKLFNKFNKKKTTHDDAVRLQNIHKKITQPLPIFQQSPPHINNSPKVDENIYKLEKPKPSTIIYLDTSREDSSNKIPKIVPKDIIIPTHSKNDIYDLNNVNQNLHTIIPMNVVVNNDLHTPIHMDVIVNNSNEHHWKRLKKKRIYKIIHIYQENYALNSYPTGLGDFIRSCFFIIQFCDKYGFKYEIIINHPIAQFLDKFLTSYSIHYVNNQSLNGRIPMFTETNWLKSHFDSEKNNYISQFLLSKQKLTSFIDYLCTLPVINGAVVSYNILFPYDPISVSQIEKICSIFEPSREIKEYVDLMMEQISIIKKQFLIFHIRSGDSYLKNESKKFSLHYLEIIKNEIIEIIFKNNNTDFLLIADNNEIKLLLQQSFPKLKFILHDITHLGEGVLLETEKIKNTLLDFYLMSYSSSIYAFTSYPHGSGFSYWSAKMYNIPYKCKYIDVK